MAGYSEVIMARFMRPQYAYAGVPFFDYQVSAGAQEQGAMLRLFISVDAHSHKITRAAFQMYGCGACIAFADLLCERLLDYHMAQLTSFNTQELAVALELPRVKMHCTWLANEALEQVTLEWQSTSASHL